GLTSATYSPATSDVPGSLVRVEVPSGPLSAGVGATTWTMYEYDDVWRTPTSATAAVTFPAAGDADWFISGYAEGADELRGTVNVVDEQSGLGRVVLFSTDPNYRAFTEGTQLLLRNALERAGGPAATSSRTVKASAVPASTRTVDSRDALVLSVRSSARTTVAGILARCGAVYDLVRTPRGVTFVVNLGGATAEDHPWARSAADEVAALGSAVIAVRLP
ncbi:MAG TPA: hypothetical protein VLW53_23555, partial [Candidatus Eisenbacteria bacterium]|nr:hypothetical protein [Candidatus Eisenbacteria bacterium]